MKTPFLAVLSLALAASAQAAATTQVTWLGHAAFQITTPKGATLIIDPWLKNPQNPAAKGGDPVAKIKKADYILVTHGHFDHVGDAVALGKATKAKLVASFELGQNMVRAMGYPKDQIGYDSLSNPGGELQLAGGEVTVRFTPAVHSSSLDLGEDKPMIYGGVPVGFLIMIKDGPTIYHSGDTAYFKDMDQLAEADIDLALLNIGGHFGMEPAAAATAARAVNARLVVPHHFASFPILAQSAEAFFKDLDEDKIAHKELTPGEPLVFDGKTPKL